MGQVSAADVRRWVVWLLGRYSEAYAYQQYRSLQQFSGWLAMEEAATPGHVELSALQSHSNAA